MRWDIQIRLWNDDGIERFFWAVSKPKPTENPQFIVFFRQFRLDFRLCIAALDGLVCNAGLQCADLRIAARYICAGNVSTKTSG